jgi:hypothetical protein
MKHLLLGMTAFGMLAQAAWSAEMRVWMSRQGGTLEAEFVSIDAENVTLSTKESKQMKLKFNDLSLADRQHLVEVAGAPESIITSGKPGLVEKDVRIDSKTFKRLDDKLTFGIGSSVAFELLESQHFLIGVAGNVRPQAIAETAERLWHGMAFHHMNFRRDWGDKRQLVLLVEDRGTYKDLGKWHVDFLAAQKMADAAQRIAATWDRVGSTSIHLPDDMREKRKLNDVALVFNVKSADMYRKDLSPFSTHGLADCLITKQMGGVSSYGAEGYFAVTTGHAFYKEISLAGKSETNLLSVEGSQNDEISSKRGFEDGTSWARSLRPLVKRGKVKAELGAMLKWKPEELTPERLVLIYSFAYFMQSDSKRLSEFAKMVRRVESSKQIPSPEEIAKIFGFATVAEFDADWMKFITEGDFK